VASPGQLYRVQEEPDLVPDLLGQGPPGRVETLLNQARLVFGEPKAEDSSFLTPLARLTRDGESIRLDPTYGPPALYLYPGHPAKPVLAEVISLLLARLGQLEEWRLDPVQWRQADLDGPGQALLALLGIMGRNLPKLVILNEAPIVSPFAVYGALAELAGELAVFSTPGGDSFLTPPKYDHQDFLPALLTLRTAIARLLSAMAIGPAQNLAFRRQEDLFSLDWPEDGLGEGPYWLSIRSGLTPGELSAQLNWRTRLGPLERLALLATHSLPGIGLNPQQTAPRGLPTRPDLAYFLIKSQDPLWTEALESQSLALLWPQAPQSVNVRLITGASPGGTPFYPGPR
jgi:type VI secretion system protein ImpJ